MGERLLLNPKRLERTKLASRGAPPCGCCDDSRAAAAGSETSRAGAQSADRFAADGRSAGRRDTGGTCVSAGGGGGTVRGVHG
jgi:hypothetical protein